MESILSEINVPETNIQGSRSHINSSDSGKLIDSVDRLLSVNDASGFIDVLDDIFNDWILNYDSTMGYRDHIATNIYELKSFLKDLRKLESK